MIRTTKPTLRVLIVDDNADDVILINLELGKHYKLVWQRVETEARVQIALDEEWDVILCDFVMPSLEAEHVLYLTRLSIRNHHVPFIIFSGQAEEDDVLEMLKKGANDFVSKRQLKRLHFVIEREMRSIQERSGEKLRQNIIVRESFDNTLLAWGRMLELRDHFSAGHTLRVTDLCLRLATFIGIPHADFTALHRGSLLHDIGKIGIPDAILLKPEELSPEEMKIMEKHPQLAFEALRDIPFLEEASIIPYCHHERWNGTGYPQHLKGSDDAFSLSNPTGKGIPFLARLFMVVDIFDALTSDRPYRKSWEKARAIAYLLEEANVTLDPDMVDALVKMIGRG